MEATAKFRDCDACHCFAIRRAARAITQLYDRKLRPSGLRATQFTLLSVLVRAGALPVNELASLLGMERTTLTRNLRPLLDQGFVRLDPGEDQRVRMVCITAAGLGAAEKALPYWREAQRAIAKNMAPASLKAIAALVPLRS